MDGKGTFQQMIHSTWNVFVQSGVTELDTNFVQSLIEIESMIFPVLTFCCQGFSSLCLYLEKTQFGAVVFCFGRIFRLPSQRIFSTDFRSREYVPQPLCTFSPTSRPPAWRELWAHLFRTPSGADLEPSFSRNALAQELATSPRYDCPRQKSINSQFSLCQHSLSEKQKKTNKKHAGRKIKINTFIKLIYSTMAALAFALKNLALGSQTQQWTPRRPE